MASLAPPATPKTDPTMSKEIDKMAPETHDPQRAQFSIGQMVQHRTYAFRGVIFDVDPEYGSTEEWLMSIPEDIRPRRNQPFYHLLAENGENTYIACVSEQNLLIDKSGEPPQHPDIELYLERNTQGNYQLRHSFTH